ncbi:DUF222 domain-containing protein [Zafaria sp. Z1313]|uniref:HNH endonuclease signature motif containing protein n=2 Tax=Zafaria sp. Z1313 TaxID=3423202 RepID=UPI003D3037F6
MTINELPADPFREGAWAVPGADPAPFPEGGVAAAAAAAGPAPGGSPGTGDGMPADSGAIVPDDGWAVPGTGPAPLPDGSGDGAGDGAGSGAVALAGLREALRGWSDTIQAQPPGRHALAGLLRGLEKLSVEVQRAQVIAARAAEDEQITLLGAAPGPGGRAEYRDTSDYLAKELHIPRSEARARLEAARKLLPRTSLTGEPLPARYEAAAAAVHAGRLSVPAALQLTRRVEKAAPTARTRPGGGTAELAAMEDSLVQTVLQDGPATMHQVADTWTLFLDPDGREPSEETKRALQGLFYQGRSQNLHVFKLVTDDAQAEQLFSVCAPAANPRTGPRTAPHDADGAGDTKAHSTETSDTADAASDPAPTAAADVEGEPAEAPADGRTRAQHQLEGLVNAVGIALSTNKLPRNGGNRPQVMVTIDYQTLLGELATMGTQRSEAVHAGLVSPAQIRRLACEAELIPVVLGSAGQVLDAGRSERLFTEEQRKILYARDRGCTAPGCTTPASGTEAHHITWWSRGGTTDIDNGALCCPFHHHLVHDGGWQITMINNAPYWIPPPHIDPARRPQRNTYFHPQATPT